MNIVFFSNNYQNLPKLINFCNKENLQLAIISDIAQIETYTIDSLCIFSYELVKEIKDESKIHSPYIILVDDHIEDHDNTLLQNAELLIPSSMITDISYISIKKIVSTLSIKHLNESLKINLDDLQMTLENKNNKKHVKLSPAEFSTIEALLKAQNTTNSKVLSKATLARKFSIHPNIVNEDSVNVVISRLKKKMDAIKINHIQIINVPKKGFTLIFN